MPAHATARECQKFRTPDGDTQANSRGTLEKIPAAKFLILCFHLVNFFIFHPVTSRVLF